MKLSIIFALLCLALAACDSSYEKVTVVKLLFVPTPPNLLETPRCMNLWGNIERYGMAMDKAANNWNDIVIDSAVELIEEGCVKRRARE